MQEDLNLTEDKKEVLRRLPDDRKWMMLLQHLGERYRAGPQEVLQEIQEIQKLKEGPDRELLTNLVVSLRSRPIRWISGFIEHGGFAVLLDNLNELETSNIHNEFEELYIKCLKSLMNNKLLTHQPRILQIGLSSVLDTEDALNVIALSLRSPSPRTRALVLEIFGAVCLIPGGHGSVLQAMDALSEIANTRFRFETVVYSLWQSCRGMTPLEKELQVASMSFINAVICGGPGVALEFRMHMRSEFIQLGLMQLIDRISHLENDLLQTQIDVFIRANEADEQAWFERIGHSPFNKDDVDELSKNLVESSKVSSSQTQFRSLLQHLTLLPSNPIERLRYMMVIDKVVQQIVLQRQGEDPDPMAAIAALDMRHLVGDMTSAEILREQEEKYQKQLEKSKRLEKEINSLTKAGEPAGDEVKMKLMNAQRQVKELENLLKEKISSAEDGEKLLNKFQTIVGAAPKVGLSGISDVRISFGGYGYAAQAARGKQTNLSSKPLKSFNWTKIPPAKVKETIWANIDDDEIHKKLRGDVYKEFEDMFAARETKATESASASKEDNIMLKAVKLDPRLIKRAILSVDQTTLPRFVLAELLKFIPTDEEMMALKQYTEDDVPNLASAERFMYEISEITNYEHKLKAMHFKSCFPEYEDDAETLIRGLQKASEDVIQSKKIAELLKVVLALGNYLNAGARGGAYGFKLGSLLKMVDTKSTIQGRKHTLLHYLAELIGRKFPEIEGFEKDLIHVEEGCKVTIPQIRQSLMTIRENLKGLEALLKILQKENEKHHKANEEKGVKEKKSNASMKSVASASSVTSAQLNVRFEDIMTDFLEKATKIYESLNERFKTAEKEFEKAINLYGEDPQTTPEDFFGIFDKFTKAYVAAKTENEKAIAKELELKKREEAKKANEDRRRKRRESIGPKSEAVGKDGGLDDLISAIRTGKAFGGGDAAAAPAPRQRRGRGENSIAEVAGSGGGDDRDGPAPSKQVTRETSTLHLKDKSFQTAEQGAVGRLKRQGSFKDRASSIQRDKAAEAPSTRPALSKDPTAHLKAAPAKDAAPADPQRDLKPTGMPKESSRDIKNRLEAAAKAETGGGSKGGGEHKADAPPPKK
nr:hypothetical protein HK105_006158 [Polyrhizophydium stewartii]